MKGITYFPGLHGIRAIAALSVLVFHTDQFTKLFGVPTLGFHRTGIAGNAVDMFFVLSGFLITYLLLQEKDLQGRISVRRFYMRRVLRIWPVYYMAVVLALVLGTTGLVPRADHPWTALLFYVLLLANVGYALGHVLRAAIPLWSVGVEEQFYLLWPHVIGRARRPGRAIIAVALAYNAVKLGVYLAFGPCPAYTLLYLTRIDILCLGALGAYWVHMDGPILRLLFHKGVQAAAWALLVLMYAYRPLHVFSFIDQQLNALVFLVIILNVGVNPGTLLRLEHPVLRWTGRISYGIYAYHFIVIHVLAAVAVRSGLLVPYAAIQLAVVSVTMLLAWISYTYYESIFMRWKHRYAVVPSGA